MKSWISSFAIYCAVGCFIASILPAAGATPIKKDANLSLAPGAAIHAKQQQISVGAGDLYLQGKFARYLFRNGEVNILFRSKDAQVYMFNTSTKKLCIQSFPSFLETGILITSGGIMAAKYAAIKSSGATEFHKIPAQNFDVIGHAITNDHRIKDVVIAHIVGFHFPEDRQISKFVSTVHGVPMTGSIPLQMKLNFVPRDNHPNLSSTPSLSVPVDAKNLMFRLKTLSIENVQLPNDFFAVPKGYKRVAAQADVITGAESAADMMNMMFPEKK